MANKQDFMDELNLILIQAKEDGKDSIEILSKNLHDRTVAKIPNNTQTHRMSSCSEAMKNIDTINFKSYTIVSSTPSEQSSTLKIRYSL